MIGGAIFYALARFLARPLLSFRRLGLAAATLYPAMLFVEPSLAPMATDATVRHYVAATVALVAIPRLAVGTLRPSQAG